MVRLSETTKPHGLAVVVASYQISESDNWQLKLHMIQHNMLRPQLNRSRHSPCLHHRLRWARSGHAAALRPSLTAFSEHAATSGPWRSFAHGRNAAARHVEAAVRRGRIIPKTWNSRSEGRSASSLRLRQGPLAKTWVGQKRWLFSLFWHI